MLRNGPPTVPELAPAEARAQRPTMAKAHLHLEERIELGAALRAGEPRGARRCPVGPLGRNDLSGGGAQRRA